MRDQVLFYKFLITMVQSQPIVLSYMPGNKRDGASKEEGKEG